jgi:hypothetical protein
MGAVVVLPKNTFSTLIRKSEKEPNYEKSEEDRIYQ